MNLESCARRDETKVQIVNKSSECLVMIVVEDEVHKQYNKNRTNSVCGGTIFSPNLSMCVVTEDIRLMS